MKYSKNFTELVEKTIVTILCDTGEHYLSTGIYDQEE